MIRSTDARRPTLVTDQNSGISVFDFDAVDNILNLADYVAHRTLPLTLILRFNPDALGLDQRMVVDHHDGNGWIYLMGCNVGSKLSFNVRNASDATSAVTSNSVLVVDTWYVGVCVATAAADGQYMYLDGVKQSITQSPGSIHAGTTPTGLTLGAHAFNSSKLNGQISDFLIYAEELNTNKIAAVTDYLSDPTEFIFLEDDTFLLLENGNKLAKES